jgi:hypothetical protein
MTTQSQSRRLEHLEAPAKDRKWSSAKRTVEVMEGLRNGTYEPNEAQVEADWAEYSAAYEAGRLNGLDREMYETLARLEAAEER